MYTLVSEIYDDVDMVIGNKNVNEIKGNISTMDSYTHFLNLIPFFPKARGTIEA